MNIESLDQHNWIDVEKNISVGHFKNDQGINLYIKHLKSITKPKTTIFFIHDVLDHHERYIDAMNMYKEIHGPEVDIYMIDIQGHGLSNGTRAHFNSISQLSNDFLAILNHLNIKNDYYLWGHGLGAIVFLDVLLGKKNKEINKLLINFKGLIASSFYFAFEKRIHPIAKLLDVVKRNPALSVDTVKVNQLIKGSDLSYQQKVVEDYDVDPLVHQRLSYKGFKVIEESLDHLMKKAYFIDFPILILSGKDDELINHDKLNIFAKSIEKKYYMFLELSDSKHDLYNDSDSKFVLKEINHWMKTK